MNQTLHDAMYSAGFNPPEVIEPGKTTRFSTNGKRSDSSGWVYLFPDEQGAQFGCWRAGSKYVWQAKNNEAMSKEEKAEFALKVKAANKAQHQEREQAYMAATAQAQAEWEAASLASPTHAYLVKKGIQAHGTRIDAQGRLLVPVHGADGNIQSLQRIAPDGNKRFFSGGRMKRGHYWLGMPENGAILLIAEGFATGASLHESTGYSVCIAFSAWNLSSVAQMIRKQYPGARLLICGDDDTQTEGNPGRTKATEAAESVAAGVVFPADAGDFNDFHQSQGLEAVRHQIEQVLNALQPVVSTFKAPALPGTDSRDGTTNTRPLAELGNAQRLFDAYGDNIRYVYESKGWIVWHVDAWQWEPDGAAVRTLAAQLPAQIYKEGGFYLGDAELFAKWARKSRESRTIHASVGLTM
ncbi:toprim domain-containing protein [Candidatus Methylospira mobilis]|uniref:toprim domain-containing protein n=1 Tax=Candidatus Methylospira mobilis TaxID=1808979 RepID=UPI0028F0763C|nr:toprim domain-containing protein [Candidatus Methylospira mobilis]WNV04979.1 toprim domain-containing protein [Candidatus Methylospira mobilis]